MGQVIRYRHNVTSDRLHRVVIVDGKIPMSVEQCNLDQMGLSRVLRETDALRMAAEEPDKLCGHCWATKTDVESGEVTETNEAES